MPHRAGHALGHAHRLVALAATLAGGCSLSWPTAHGVGDASPTPVPCADGAFDYREVVPHNATGVPVIVDRVPACPPLEPMPMNVNMGFGDAGVPAGLAVYYAAAWSVDPNDPTNGGLYVFVEVDKTTALCPPLLHSRNSAFDGDVVEIFVDDDGVFEVPGHYDSAGTRQFLVSAPAPDAGSVPTPVGTVGSGEPSTWTVWTSSGFQSFPGPHAGTSYRVVAYIQGRDLGLPANWSLLPGASIGLYVAVDVGEASPTTGACGRVTQIELVDSNDAGCHYPDTDTSCFRTPRLLP